MSEHKTIGAAWAAIYAGMPGIALDATNPHFRNKYASLPNILETIRPHLAEHGCSLRHRTGTEDGVLWVEAVLDHTSGESMTSGPLPLKPTKSDPQGVGSALTYGKRYTVCMLLGLAPDGDDDGNAAARPAKAKRPGVEAAASPEAEAKGMLQDWCGFSDIPDLRAAWADTLKASGAGPTEYGKVSAWILKHTEADTPFIDAIQGGK